MQRWVMSVLAVTTILHLAAGLTLAAVFMDEARQGSRIGLTVIAAVIGMLAIVAGRLVHGKSALSAWLLLGLVPGLVGLWIILR